MTPLPRFDPARPCAKCGNRSARSRWFAKDAQTGQEGIDRQCDRCGFVWTEAPLDAAEGET